ncbi:MAG: hypothetical protein IE913_07105 [Halothiobacillus sp.]|nr:hypothetical protein [Halothiobacillus sp.]
MNSVKGKGGKASLAAISAVTLAIVGIGNAHASAIPAHQVNTEVQNLSSPLQQNLIGGTEAPALAPPGTDTDISQHNWFGGDNDAHGHVHAATSTASVIGPGGSAFEV